MIAVSEGQFPAGAGYLRRLRSAGEIVTPSPKGPSLKRPKISPVVPAPSPPPPDNQQGLSMEELPSPRESPCQVAETLRHSQTLSYARAGTHDDPSEIAGAIAPSPGQPAKDAKVVERALSFGDAVLPSPPAAPMNNDNEKKEIKDKWFWRKHGFIVHA